uniref:Major facilitator superfamily (MFS) profile domain-containing protein n=1 Tax=Hyaloperonospora arabidopsidis (strain Emoy2) TaxID=559515 RepID=M4C362_HYAAE
MFGIRFSRWYLFVAAFAVQVCLSCIYAWSVLNQPVDFAIYGDATKGRAVNTFYICLGVSGITTAALGPIIERRGPRWAVSIGSTLFLIGHTVTGIGCHYKCITCVYVGYGVINAIGMAMCYISTVSTLQKWFPDYRGTAAGFAVAGSGAGAAVWSKVYLPTINAVGLPWMFVLLGSIMSAIMYASTIAMRVPPPEFTVNGLNIHGDRVENNDVLDEKLDDTYSALQTPKAGETTNFDAIVSKLPTKLLSLKQAVLTPDFVFINLMVFANQLFGVIVLSRLSSMCTDLFGKSATTASDIVSINSAFNCCGRLVFSSISDLLVKCFSVEKVFARKVIYFFTLGAQIIVIGSLPTVIRRGDFSSFVIEMFVLTSCYGGGLGTIPALITDMFGAFNVGPMHGIVFLSVSICAVIGGLTFNISYRDKIGDGMSISEAYIDNIQVILVIVCIGFAMLFLVRTNETDRFEPGYHYSVCGKRVLSIPAKEKFAAVRHQETAEVEASVAEKVHDHAV